MANFNFIIVFYSIRVASLMVVKSTAFSVPPKRQSYNILYRINILIRLTLINMFLKTKQISYSLWILSTCAFNWSFPFTLSPQWGHFDILRKLLRYTLTLKYFVHYNFICSKFRFFMNWFVSMVWLFWDDEYHPYGGRTFSHSSRMVNFWWISINWLLILNMHRI